MGRRGQLDAGGVEVNMSDNEHSVTSVWAGYARTMNGLTWRLATIDDLPAIMGLWKAKERFLGCKQDMPQLFARPTLIVMVAENEAGVVVDGLYVEATVDVTKLGCSAEGFESTLAVADDLGDWLKSLGFRMASIVVPKRLSGRMGAILRKIGFHSKEERSAYWSKRL